MEAFANFFLPELKQLTGIQSSASWPLSDDLGVIATAAGVSFGLLVPVDNDKFVGEAGSSRTPAVDQYDLGLPSPTNGYRAIWGLD